MAGVQTLLKIIINKLLITMKQGYLTFDGPITKIPNSAFANSQLTSIYLPDSVTSLSAFAFSNCHYLTNIDLSNIQITELPTNVFASCWNLTSIELSNTIQKIGDGCFLSCTSLTNITLPDSIKYIGPGAFLGSGITEINYKSITYKNVHKLKQVLLDNNVIFENTTFYDTNLDYTIEPNNEATIITTINYTTADEQPLKMHQVDGWGNETKLIGNEYK